MHWICKKPKKGQGIVELALILPMLVLLILGIVDMGRLFFTYTTLRSAAQEGANYGSMYPTDVSNIRLRIRSASAYSADITTTSLPDSKITIVTVPATNPCAGITNSITVTLTVDFQPFVTNLLGWAKFPISARVSNTILAPKCP